MINLITIDNCNVLNNKFINNYLKKIVCGDKLDDLSYVSIYIAPKRILCDNSIYL